jgi:hypothetical protein
MDVAVEFMPAIRNALQANKRLADRAVEQLPDGKLHIALDNHTNSVAVIMKHVGGNCSEPTCRSGPLSAPWFARLMLPFAPSVN